MAPQVKPLRVGLEAGEPGLRCGYYRCQFNPDHDTSPTLHLDKMELWYIKNNLEMGHCFSLEIWVSFRAEMQRREQCSALGTASRQLGYACPGTWDLVHTGEGILAYVCVPHVQCIFQGWEV